MINILRSKNIVVWKNIHRCFYNKRFLTSKASDSGTVEGLFTKLVGRIIKVGEKNFINGTTKKGSLEILKSDNIIIIEVPVLAIKKNEEYQDFVSQIGEKVYDYDYDHYYCVIGAKQR